MEKFSPEQFEKRSGQAQVETDLRKYLRSVPVLERIDFINRLWPLNYVFAVSLARSSQIPQQELAELLNDWLAQNKHNTVKVLIEEFEPLLGENRFWKIATECELSTTMVEFLNYHGKGKLSLHQNG